VKIVYCSKCGSKLDEGVKFCFNCGQVINNIENTSAQKSLYKKATTSRKNLFICIGILVVVLIVTIAGVYGLRPREGKATPPTYSTPPTYAGDNQSFTDGTKTQPTNEFPSPTTSTLLPDYSVNIGDFIQFAGTEWRVLDIQDDMALILSDKILGTGIYHDVLNADVTWENSYIRKSLNGFF